MDLNDVLESEKKKRCEICLEAHAKNAALEEELQKALVVAKDVNVDALPKVIALKNEIAVLKSEVACKTNQEDAKEKRLCWFETKQIANFRHLMAGNELILTQLFGWFRSTFPDWKGLDIEDVSKNIVQHVNGTDIEARCRNKVICWTKFGPVDLTNKKHPICTEMFNHFHGTITMKTEAGIVPQHWMDSALMKRPLNVGEMVQNVNSNPDLFKYIKERIPHPAILKS